MANIDSELVVEAVSDKWAGGFKAGDTWYGPDKQGGPAKEVFTALKRGMKVKINHNDKWVRTLEVLSAGSSAPAAQYNKPQASSEPSSSTPYVVTEKDAQIARGAAIKALFYSPTLLKDMDMSQACSVVRVMAPFLAEFIATGNFSKEGEAQ